MAYPDVRMRIEDGALGVQPNDVNAVFAVAGVSSGGTPGRIYSFSNFGDIVPALGWGPAAELAAYRLALYGGTVHVVKVPTASPGQLGPVLNGARGPGAVSFLGEPFDRYFIRVRIMRPGGLGEAQFQYSFDGGESYSPTLTVPTGPGGYLVEGTGITILFRDGTPAPAFREGDVFLCNTTEPTWELSALNDSVDRLLSDPREWRHLHIAGSATPVQNGETSISALVALDSRMQQAEALYRYTYVIAEARDIADGIPNEDEQAWMSSLVNATRNFASTRVAVAAGHCLLQSFLPFPGKTYGMRSVAWPIGAQRAILSISNDSGFVAKTGWLRGVQRIFHNSERIRTLDAARFTTARTIIGRAGFYATHIRMMAPEGSDFQFVQHREVMDLACRVSRNAFLAYFNADIPTNESGTIEEKSARQMEGYAKGMLAEALSGHASAARVVLNRTDNVLSSNRLRATVRLRPKAYAKEIEVNIGYVNPALEASSR